MTDVFFITGLMLTGIFLLFYAGSLLDDCNTMEMRRIFNLPGYSAKLERKYMIKAIAALSIAIGFLCEAVLCLGRAIIVR